MIPQFVAAIYAALMAIIRQILNIEIEGIDNESD